MKKFIGLLLMLIPVPLFATNLGQLARQALDNPMKPQAGVLSGENANNIRRITHSSGGDILAEARIVKAFRQEGCGRVEMKVVVPNVPTTDGRVISFVSTTELNICRDGSPAAESKSTAPERDGGTK